MPYLLIDNDPDGEKFVSILFPNSSPQQQAVVYLRSGEELVVSNASDFGLASNAINRIYVSTGTLNEEEAGEMLKLHPLDVFVREVVGCGEQAYLGRAAIERLFEDSGLSPQTAAEILIAIHPDKCLDRDDVARMPSGIDS